MKKGIEIWSDYNAVGKYIVKLSKKKGKFTLDEIRDALTEYMEDVYLIMIKALDMDLDEEPDGDYVECYVASEVIK